MYGCLLVPPSHPEADFGVLFMHNEGYSTMCGHGIIGLVTVILEHRMFPVTEPETIVTLETPSGLVKAQARVQKGKVGVVNFQNVPSFVDALDQTVEVPGVGLVHYDLAFGGAYYGFCRAEDLGLSLLPETSRRLADLGMQIKQAIISHRLIKHPVEPDLGFLYGIIFFRSSEKSDVDFRQVCIFAAGALDRSPTGTGVSALLALLDARGRLESGRTLTIESILGTCFTGRMLNQVVYGGVKAIIPEVEGRAYITGQHEFLIDPDDPLREGFLVR